MTTSDEDLARWKATFAKDGVVYETDDEYREAISNLVGFFDILIEMDQKQKAAGSPTDKTENNLYLIDKSGSKIIL